MWSQLDPRLGSFVDFVAFLGFLVTATLIINLNFKVFRRVFGEKTFNYWWLFIILITIPILLIIYIFVFLFK